jgi:glycosyltransferase involved in cell wall biosynthesis
VDLALVAHRVDAADGTGGYAFEILKRVSREHKVTLYAASVGPGLPPEVKVVRVPAVPRPAYAMILSFPLAFEAVRRRHDVVHAQGWVTSSADVVTAHIVLKAWRAAARRAGVRAPWGERLFGAFVERREAQLLRSGARQIIVPSARAATDLAHCYGRTRDVTVIPHGFDRVVPSASRAAARRRLGLPSNTFVALYVGDPRKGLRVAIQALDLAERVHLLVLSHSAPGSYPRSSRILWAPRDFTLSEAHAAADVLLHPSIYDTFGLVVAEAMAAGLPVIVSREAGVVELIEHSRSGWVLERNDPQAAGAALRVLSAEPALCKRLSEGGRATAARHSWDGAARETLAVYERTQAERR